MAASCPCEQCRTLRAYNEGYLGSKDTAEILLRRVDDAKSGSAGRFSSEEIAASLRRVREDAMSPFAGYNGRVLIGASTYANVTDWRIDAYFPRIEEKPMSSSNTPTPQGIVNDLHRLPENADLSEIKGNLGKIEAERKARIEKALSGQAELLRLSKKKARHFVVLYWCNGEVRIAEGLEHPMQVDGSGKPKGYNIYIDDNYHPFFGRYQGMEKFRKFFDEHGYPYHIDYFDQ